MNNELYSIFEGVAGGLTRFRDTAVIVQTFGSYVAAGVDRTDESHIVTRTLRPFDKELITNNTQDAMRGNTPRVLDFIRSLGSTTSVEELAANRAAREALGAAREAASAASQAALPVLPGPAVVVGPPPPLPHAVVDFAQQQLGADFVIDMAQVPITSPAPAAAAGFLRGTARKPLLTKVAALVTAGVVIAGAYFYSNVIGTAFNTFNAVIRSIPGLDEPSSRLVVLTEKEIYNLPPVPLSLLTDTPQPEDVAKYTTDIDEFIEQTERQRAVDAAAGHGSLHPIVIEVDGAVLSDLRQLRDPTSVRRFNLYTSTYAKYSLIGSAIVGGVLGHASAGWTGALIGAVTSTAVSCALSAAWKAAYLLFYVVKK